MSEREKHITEAATRVFLRYGVKRASMNDIAEEAGVSRQTLYNAFKNKDEILCGSLRIWNAEILAKLEAELPKIKDLEAKIEKVLQEIALNPFVTLHSSPNAQDLVEGYNSAGKAEMAAGAQKFRAVLAEILSPYADALAARGLTPKALGEHVQRAAAAFKYIAEDEAHLRALLETIVRLVVSAAAPR